MTHYFDTSCDHTAHTIKRQATLKAIITDKPHMRDLDYARLMSKAGFPVAQKTISEDRKALQVPSLVLRTRAEVRLLSEQYGQTPAEVVDTMRADGWSINVDTVWRHLRAIRGAE